MKIIEHSKELVYGMRNLKRGHYHSGWINGDHSLKPSDGSTEFQDWQTEQMSWKKSCYIGNWSFLGQWNLVFEGPDALNLLKDLTTNSFENFRVGTAKHNCHCNEDGKISAEGIVMHISEGRYRVQSVSAVYLGYKIETGKYNVKAWKHQVTNYQVYGPTALALCEKLAGESLNDIKYMNFRSIEIKGHNVIFLRRGMSEEVGFELQTDFEEFGRELYNLVLEIGQEFGIKQLGSRTAMINHLESCFPACAWHYVPDLYLPGFNEYVTKNWDLGDLPPTIATLRGSFNSEDLNDWFKSPLEMGWDMCVQFDHDFLGNNALKAEMASPSRKVATLEFNSDDMIDIYASLFQSEEEPYQFMDIPHQQFWQARQDKVLNKQGKLVGLSTVPGYSLFFRKVLALAYMDIEYLSIGTQVEVLWGDPGERQRTVRAIVSSAPYKRDNTCLGAGGTSEGRYLDLSTLK